MPVLSDLCEIGLGFLVSEGTSHCRRSVSFAGMSIWYVSFILRLLCGRVLCGLIPRSLRLGWEFQLVSQV